MASDAHSRDDRLLDLASGAEAEASLSARQLLQGRLALGYALMIAEAERIEASLRKRAAK